MPNLFGVDFRGVFATALGGKLLPLSLTIRTPGASYDASDPGSGPRYSTTAFTCSGAMSVTETADPNDSSVRQRLGDLIILLGTISTPGIRPKREDVINMAPPGTTVAQDWYVLEADYDPAGASCAMKLRG